MLSCPLDLGFKIVTIGTRVRVMDATGRQVAYVRKKKFRLREDVMVYEGEDQNRSLFRMKADRVLDFGANYAISAPDGRAVGTVGRRGVRSIWSSSYEIADARGGKAGSIREENPWVKVLDGLLESLPFGDALGGLFFNPAFWSGCETATRCAWKSSAPCWRAGFGSRSVVSSRRRTKTCSSPVS